MQTTIDLNSDMGESYGLYRYGEDEQILPYITSINLACGFHAGDPVVMNNTVHLAKKMGVQVWAHPGFPDILGFGRRYMHVSPKDLYAYVLYQMGALFAFLKTAKLSLSHVKLHGALYMMALEDQKLSEAVCEAIYQFDSLLPIYTIADSETEKAAKRIGLHVITEYFADRPYTEKGVKMFGWTQEEIGSAQDIANRVLELLKTGFVTGLGGIKVPVKAQTICVHSDTPRSTEIAKTIYDTLKEKGIQLRSPERMQILEGGMKI